MQSDEANREDRPIANAHGPRCEAVDPHPCRSGDHCGRHGGYGGELGVSPLIDKLFAALAGGLGLLLANDHDFTSLEGGLDTHVKRDVLNLAALEVTKRAHRKGLRYYRG